jgi:hypothetical protein
MRQTPYSDHRNTRDWTVSKTGGNTPERNKAPAKRAFSPGFFAARSSSTTETLYAPDPRPNRSYLAGA